MFKLANFAIAAAVFGAPMTAAATTTYFTDQSSFDTAAAPVTVEDFSSSSLVSGLSYTSTNGYIGSGVFNDKVVRGSASTTFSFANPATAFGADFNEGPNGFGQGIQLTLTLMSGSSVVLSQQVAQYTGGFFGFVTSTPFTSVQLAGGTATGVEETYTLDNLTFNTAPTGPTGGVPEPAAWALLLLGFGAVGGAMRRTRSRGLGQLGSTARLG